MANSLFAYVVIFANRVMRSLVFFRVWGDSKLLCDAQLKRLSSEMIDLQFMSKFSSTVLKYASCWKKWRSWAQLNTEVKVIPTHPLHVALYLTELCLSAIEKGNGISVLEGAGYAIRWAHQMAGLLSPTDHPLVKSYIEGARRNLGCPIIHSERAF